MASHDLINTKPTILGATLGAIPGIAANPPERFSFNENESICLHRSGPLLENGLDRRKNRYGRHGFPSVYSISISTVGVDGARFSERFFENWGGPRAQEIFF